MTSEYGQHQFTWIRWYNSAPDARGRCSKVASADVGPYEAIPYGARKPGEVHASGKPPHPEFGQWQWGIACSKTARTLVVDVDDCDAYRISDTEYRLPASRATSLRVTPDGDLKLHFVVTVPEDLLRLWPPKQGAAAWGDLKSNGFSYVTGVHYSGTEYQAAQNGPVEATAELLEVLAREACVTPQGTGSGAGAGDWEREGYRYPDGKKHVRGVADVASMVARGLDDGEITALMTAILQRSENYAGAGEEIAGWIDSARGKYDIAEGESWDSRQAEEDDRLFAGMFGRERWEKRKADVAAGRFQVQLDYVRDPRQWLAAREQEPGVPFVPAAPDLRPVPLRDLLNPGRVPVEPAGSSDAHLARMILRDSRNILRMAADSGGWLVNEGQAWTEWGSKSDAKEKAKSAVIAWGESLKTVDQASAEIEQAKNDAAVAVASGQEGFAGKTDEEYDDQLKRLAKNHQRLNSSEGTGAVASMLVAQAGISPENCVRIADLDAEPYVLWAGGIPWDLRSPDLVPVPDANPVHLKTCLVTPAPGVHPLFSEVLAALFPEEDVRAWALREIAGAALWGETSKHHPVLDGKPNAGKSTLTDAVRKVLGSYAVDIDPDKLIGGRDSSAAEEEKFAMIGARMVLMDEPPKRDRQSVSQFNRLASGTGEIAASAKYKGRVSAEKRFNLVINQNQRNRMKLDAEGVKQRLVFIPASGHVKPDLYSRFTASGTAEYPAVLATLIKECALFHAGQRLPVPLSAKIAFDAAYADGDEFQQWLFASHEIPQGDVTKQDEDAMPTIDSVRKAFAMHVRDLRGAERLTRSELREALAANGVTVRDYGGSQSKKRNVVHLKALPAAQLYYQQ